MEKSPGDRYPSISDFRDDLVNWLEHRPLQARPLGLHGRIVRSAQRHPLVATLAMGILIVSLLGLGLTSWQWRNAERERKRAEQNLAAAQQAVREYSTEIAKGWGPLHATPGTRLLRQSLLQRAVFHFQKFIADNGPAADAGLLGHAHFCLGDLASKAGDSAAAEGHFRTAIGYWEDTRQFELGGLPDHYWLGQAYLGLGNVALSGFQPSQAVEWFQAAREQLRHVPAQTPAGRRMALGLARAQTSLATSNAQIGKAGEAREQFQLAAAQLESIDSPSEDPAFELACQRARAVHRRCWGNLLCQQGDRERGVALLESAWKIHSGLARHEIEFPWHRDEWCATAIDLAIADREAGDLARAELRLRKGIAAIEVLCSIQPQTPAYQTLKARAEGNLANLLVDQGRFMDARRIYERLLEQEASLPQETLSSDEPPLDQTSPLVNLALLERELGEPERARDHLRRALRLLDRVQGPRANSPDHLARKAEASEQLGLTLALLHQPEQAEMLLRQALLDHRQAVDRQPEHQQCRNGLAECLVNFAACIAHVDSAAPANEGASAADLDRANESLHEAVCILNGLIQIAPDVALYRNNLSRARYNQAFVAQQQGDEATSDRHLLESARILEQLNEDFSLSDRDLRRLIQRWRTLAARHASQQDRAAAVEMYRKVIDLQARRAAGNSATQWSLASSHIQLANQFRYLGQSDEAESHYRSALNLHQSLAESAPDRTNYRAAVWGSHVNLGLVELDRDDFAAARKELRCAQEGLQAILAKHPQDSLATRFLRNCEAALQQLEQLQNGEGSRIDQDSDPSPASCSPKSPRDLKSPGRR